MTDGRANLDLQIVRAETGYHASVMPSPGGEGEADITLPARRVDLGGPLAGVATGELPGMLDVVAGRAGRLRPTAMADFGRRLFDAVFIGTVGVAYRRNLAIGVAQGSGLRIRIRLAGVPELLDMPWELLFDGARDEFVAASSRTPLVRYLDLPQKVEPLQVDGPIRMLVVVSSPSDLERIDVPGEWSRLSDALEPLVSQERLAVEPLETPTLRELEAAVSGGGFHVLHYVGHGGFDPSIQQGVLALEADDGTSDLVRAEDVAEALVATDAPRLVVLNTCEGARGSVVDPFAGTAQSLVGHGTAAVVAMQFEVTDEAALGFAQGFYGALTGGSPVDDAVTAGRVSMMTEGDGSEWATPVLYSHAADLRIFAVSPALPPPPPPPFAGDGRLVAGTVDIHVDAEHGVRLDPRAGEVVPRPRPMPVAVLPPPFPLLLGRDQEVLAAAGVEAGQAIVFAATAGWGKTAVLRAVANRVVGAAPGGLVFLRVLSRRVTDVVQFVFEQLFETDVPFKPTTDQVAKWLDGAEVAVVLDDADLDAEQLDALAALLPQGRLIVAGGASTPGDGRTVVALAGLTSSAGVRLVELELGRSLSGEERRDAERLCDAVGGSPSRILQEAARAWETGGDLGRVVDDLAKVASAGGGGPDPAWILDRPPAEQRALGVLAAAHPAAVHVSHLTAVAGLDDPLPVLESLERRALVRSGSPLYDLAFEPTEAIEPVVQAERWQASLVDHLVGWATQASPHDVLRDADLVLAAMRLGYRAGRHVEVARMGRAVEGALIEGRRWGQWGLVASQELSAAVDAGDVAHQAWALHQLGSRALGLGDAETAREDLGRALEIRESIGDTRGAEVTRHNLRLAGPGPRRRRRRRDDGSGGGLGSVLGVLTVLLVLGVVGFGLWLLLRDGDGPIDGDPVGSVEPKRLGFGDVTQGTSSTLAVIVSNAGGGLLTVTNVSFAQSQAAFSFDSRCDEPIPAAEACRIDVTFAPEDTGLVIARLRIEDDTGDVARVRLEGTGVAQPLPGISLEPPAVDFGPQPLEIPATRTVDIISTGEAVLNVESVDVQGDPAFSIDAGQCVGRRLEPDDRCTVLVTFTPSSRVGVSGEVVIIDDAGEGRQTVALTGVGVTDRPNLIVTGLRQTGEATEGDGFVDVPVEVIVRNDGDVAAGVFKVSVEYTGGNITSPSPLIVAFVADPSGDVDPANGAYPFTINELLPSGEVTFTGVLRFIDEQEGATVTVTAIADSCVGDELVPEPPCRVLEVDEEDNRSAPIQIVIPDFSDVE